MRAKYLIIAILIVLLALTVKSMLKIEENIRAEKIRFVEVEDRSKALFNPLPAEELAKVSENCIYNFKTENNYFSILNHQRWEELFLKGVNIGTAVPGKFPTEFSLTFEQYLEWFRLIGEMNANVVRVYTVLPPEFYQALAVHNQQHFSRKLYLIQGVWTELPPAGNFFDKNFTRSFQEEIIKVIDIIHGKAVVKEKPGHAYGVYQTDISAYTIAFLLGREWEPDAVEKTCRLNKITSFKGNFIQLHQGNAMEAWLAEMMDFTIHYETQTYQSQRPVSFVNWLPLDPMYHHSEYIEAEYVREYDNDLKSLDYTHFHRTPLYKAGFFASYHVYPYYPDFIYNEKKYSEKTKSDGTKDNFYFYLLDLKDHCRGIPLLISEYGLPSSRGNSHYTPLGFDQGGHSEQEQAELSVILTRDIYHAGCAGAVYFEWIDEWFKRNWLVMDFEEPAENRRLWHNMENPEQNYGILAYESIKKVIDAKSNDWPEIRKNKKEKVYFSADPAYFYLLADLPDFDFSRHNLYIAFDTYDKSKGEHRLAFLPGLYEHGIEFLARLSHKDTAELFVDDYYTVFTDRGENIVPAYHSVNNDNGDFVSQWLLANRKRESVIGEKYPEVRHNRGILHYGNSSLSRTSNADWYWNNQTKTLEMRLTWQILNVTDPSGHAVLDNNPRTRQMDYSNTDGFHIQLFITDKKDQLIQKIPEDRPYFYCWEGWIEPRYRARTKPLYYRLKKEFSRLNKIPVKNKEKSVTDKFDILPYPGNYVGAISLMFNLNEKTIQDIVLPAMHTYDIQPSFILSEMPQSDERKLVLNLNRSFIQHLDSAGANFIFKPNENNRDNSPEYLKTRWIFINEGLQNKCNTVWIEEKSPYLSNLMNSPDIGVILAGEEAFFNSKPLKINKINPDIGCRKIDSILNNNKGWYTLSVENIVRNSGAVGQPATVTEEQLHRLIRIIRNDGYWITSPEKYLAYQYLYQNSLVKSRKFNNLIFLTCEIPEYITKKEMPLSVRFQSSAKIIKVNGSAEDGIYNLHGGEAILSCYPGKEVTIEIIEP